MENSTSRSQQLTDRYFGFPDDLTYEEFLSFPQRLREEIAEKNRIIQTDTYNRSMAHCKQELWSAGENYVLQLRRAPRGYLIASGIRRHIENAVGMPITQNQFDFAKAFYENYAQVPFFNEDMWRMVLEKHGGYLPIEIDAVPDGTALLPGDPVLRVKGGVCGELAAHIEPELHRVFYDSLVATQAHEIAQKIGADRFIEVGKRGALSREVHLQAVAAMYQGGGLYMSSNDSAAAVHPEIKDVGTLGHRFIQFYETEEEAFVQAIENMDSVSLLIDLTDSIRGIDLALKLKERYRDSGKKIWIRLDSGDLTEQTLYALKEFQRRGYTDPSLDKIVVESISDVDEMVELDRVVERAGFDARAHILYGAGGLLVSKDKIRSVASSGYKSSGVYVNGELDPKCKFSNSPGKESIPGWPGIYQTENGRLIAQVGEMPELPDLLIPAYRNGEILLPEGLSAGLLQSQATFDQILSQIGGKTPHSDDTHRMVRDIRKLYGLAAA